MSSQPEKKPFALASMGNIALLFAASSGLPFTLIKKTTGLDPADLMNPDGRIPLEYILNFFRLLADACPDRNMSLEIAGVVPFSFLGSPWRVLNQAPNPRVMMVLFAENSQMVADQLEFEIIENNDDLILRMYHPMDDIDEGMGGEVGIGIAARIAREYFGEGLIERVQFRHAPRSPLNIYENWFGTPVRFHAPCNALIVRRETFELPNKKSGPETEISLRHRLTRLRRDLGMKTEDDLADVRQAIEHNAQKGDYSVSKLARSLATSQRNLQRRLRSSGTSASDMLDAARQTKALELLANKGLCVKEISHRLGYGSERGFCKAFERWTQKTPARFRREMIQELGLVPQ